MRVWLLLAVMACGSSDSDVPAECRFRTAADEVAPPPIDTPRWAFRPWISKDISNDADTRAFVQGFEERGIPVGAVVFDSPWETHYNSFVVNEERYPAFGDLVADLHAKDIRTVMWITQMVNRTGFDLETGGDSYAGESPNFAQGRDCNFFVDNGADYLWWKGNGAGVDFFNSEAVGWWHRQQDRMYDLGIDGWKLDFGEDYLPGPMIETAAGPVTKQEYSEAYYADFYAYGASRRPEFVTMVRPYDRSYGMPGRFYARPEHAPVGWVGDNRRDWVGLADALDHMFRSAAAGYAVVGSDIGGYLDKDDEDLGIAVPPDTLVFARWTAVGALTPFMQLHGRANLAPWTVDDHVDETVALYRYWATLHDELVPYWFTLSRAAYRGGPTPLRPLGDETTWAGDYRYLIGDAFLVAPILDAASTRDIALPAGRWYDWWRPGDAPIEGTLTAFAMPERDRIPLFVREGAIVPLHTSSSVTGLGTPARRDALTVLVWPAATATAFELVDHDDVATTITARRTVDGAEVSFSRVARTTYARIRLDAAPGTVRAGATLAEVATDDELDAATTGWRYDAANKWLWVKLAPGSSAIIAE